MRVIVAGAGGMLGHDVVHALERAGHEPLAADRSALDVLDEQAVSAHFERQRPDAAINCAAWTDVDGAEANAAAARAVNVDGARNLARGAAANGASLVHVSTDYVFAGDPPLDTAGTRRPYVESDPTGPRSVYGQTKLEGEHEVLGASPRHTVVRTAWLYGVHGKNFAATMLRLASERDTVQVVDDQIGSPTWSGHLAPALVGLLEREVSGLVHLAGGGHVSWNGFCREIFRQAEVGCVVEAIGSDQMPRPAPRPAWSALESERDDVLAMPDWRDGVAGYLAARMGITRT